MKSTNQPLALHECKLGPGFEWPENGQVSRIQRNMLKLLALTCPDRLPRCLQPKTPPTVSGSPCHAPLALQHTLLIRSPPSATMISAMAAFPSGSNTTTFEFYLYAFDLIAAICSVWNTTTFEFPCSQECRASSECAAAT